MPLDSEHSASRANRRDNAVFARVMLVLPGDPAYRAAAAREAEFWARASSTDVFTSAFELGSVLQAAANRTLTGDERTTWLDDLMARGPFEHAAVLGCTDGVFELPWIRARASQALDVFDLSEEVIARLAARAQPEAGGCEVRFACADLNFVKLAPRTYDVVWSSGCLHHVTNLEYLFDEIAAALRPGGLFAFQDYVGERRLRFAPERLRLVNAVLMRVPARYRRTTDLVELPSLDDASPFCAVRSDEVLAVAQARFNPVHVALGGALYPLAAYLDLAALEREAPEVLEEVVRAESCAGADPAIRPVAAYAVFRRD